MSFNKIKSNFSLEKKLGMRYQLHPLSTDLTRRKHMCNSVGLGLLPILWSSGPAQATAVIAVPYNLSYIAKQKLELSKEKAKPIPSAEKIKTLEKEIYSAWKAIQFHKDASRPIMGTMWEVDAYWKKENKRKNLIYLLSREAETTANEILAKGSDIEKRITDLFAICAPRDYNPDLEEYKQLKNRAFGLMKQLHNHQEKSLAEFIKDWPQIAEDLRNLDLS